MCKCENLMEEEDDGYCADKKKRLSGVYRVLSVILLIATLALAVVSFASCCCFGQFAKENGVLGRLGRYGTGIPVFRGVQTA